MTEQLVSKNKFYVYIYFDPRKSGQHTYGSLNFEYEPFYVGKGTKSRHIAHIAESKRVTNPESKKLRTIQKIRKQLGIDPIVVKYKEHLLEEDALALEKQLIKAIGRDDLGQGPLTNLSDGGEDHANLNQQSRNKIAAKARTRPMPIGMQAKAAISNLGCKRSLEFKEATSKRLKGVPKPYHHRETLQKSKQELINRFPLGFVVLCEQTGVIFLNGKQAETFYKTPSGRVNNLCRGSAKPIGDELRFSRVCPSQLTHDQITQFLNSSFNTNKKFPLGFVVECNETKQRFSSTFQAEKVLNLPRHSVHPVCSGRALSTHGMSFSFVDVLDIVGYSSF